MRMKTSRGTSTKTWSKSKFIPRDGGQIRNFRRRRITKRKAYLSAILDLKSRDIVSFAVGRSNNNQLVFDTFDLAIRKYPDAHPLFHSDRGFQYTSKVFKSKLDKQGMLQSMSRVGRCIDNGPMEGLWGILKCEMYYLNQFATYDELVAAIEAFIYYYNHQRRQHKLNCLPPATYRSLLEAA